MFTFGLPPSLSVTLSIWPFWPKNHLCEAVLGSEKPGCYSCLPHLGLVICTLCLSVSTSVKWKQHQWPCDFFFTFIFLFNLLAALGPYCCFRAFCGCSERELVLLAVDGLPIVVTCCRAQALGAWTSVGAARGLSCCSFRAVEPQAHNCSSWAQLLHITWNLPDQGSNLCPLHWQAESYTREVWPCDFCCWSC